MRQLLSRWRYELAALIVAVACIGLHLKTEVTHTVGLTKGEQSSPEVRAVQLLEGRATDLKFRFRGPVAPHPDVVVVAIDEKSAQKYGLWPWPRERIAQALERLLDADVKAVGLDIEFTDEASDDSGVFRTLLSQLDASAAPPESVEAVRAELKKLATASGDEALQRAFARGGARVVQGIATFSSDDIKDFSAAKLDEYQRLLGPQLITSVPGPGGTTLELPVGRIEAYRQYSAQTPLGRFIAEGSGFGHFNFAPDVDGSIRRTPAVVKLDAPPGFLPSMPLRTAAAYLGARIVPTWDRAFNLTALQLKSPERTISWPIEGNEPFALIDYVGPGSAFRTLSVVDVIEGKVPAEQLKGKLVLIGVTLVGSSGDQRVTPFKELEPGIYTHASVASNLLMNRFLERPDTFVLWEALSMLLIGLTMAFAIPRLKSFSLKGLLMVASILVWLTIDYRLFAADLQLATIMPLANIVLSSFSLIFLGYLSVDREKLKMRNTFSRYLGEDVMEEAIKNPDKLNQGEKREMTVLFSDIRGFTTLSERMLPEKLASFINEYLSPMTRIVFDEKGTLDKYIGDAVMAFWNAPLDQPDHALRACKAAVAMLVKLEELKVKWRAENFPEFDIGVGINTGPMIVGNMGSDVRVDYTVMGDAVNLASRLEGTNKEYETRVIVGEGTWPHVKDQVIGRRLGAVRVKGKRKPVRIYELRGIGQPSGPELDAIRRFEAGIDAYTEQKWDEAAALFKGVLDIWVGDAPTRRYLEEIAWLKDNPPGAGWDGVYTATSK